MPAGGRLECAEPSRSRALQDVVDPDDQPGPCGLLPHVLAAVIVLGVTGQFPWDRHDPRGRPGRTIGWPRMLATREGVRLTMEAMPRIGTPAPNAAAIAVSRMRRVSSTVLSASPYWELAVVRSSRTSVIAAG